nr:hypothetical protein [Babesia bovis]
MTLDGVQKGGMSAIAANTTRKAYDKETFAALVESCTRLFCCDEEIVIVDLLLAVEKAINERDIEAEIGISERKVHEYLSRLERHGLVTKVTTGQQYDIMAKPVRQPKSARDLLPQQQHQSTTQCHWRLSKYFIVVVHYKLNKMEEILQQRRRSLHECDRFICGKCNAVYDSLDVQKLELDGFDAHFICYCGSKVELDDTETKDSMYSSQQQRCEEQVKTLKKCLSAAWGMDVPQFPIYVKNKSKGEEQPQEDSDNLTSAPSVVEAASSVVSNGSGTSETSSTMTSMPVVKSLMSDFKKQTSDSLGKKLETGKIKFHMHGMINKKSAGTHVTSATKLVTEHTKAPVATTTPKEVKVQGSTPEVTTQEDSKPSQESGDDITFYIGKLGRSFPLVEAQNHQQHMSNEEFENF